MMTTDQDTIDRAVGELLLAYNSGSVLDDLSAACRPRTVDGARRIHDGLVGKLGGHGGWKVGRVRPGQEPGCAPIPRNRILHSPARWVFPLSGPVEIEVEVAVLIGRDLTQPGIIGTQEVRASIGALHPAIEVVSSRLRNKEALPALTAMADLQGNAGLILGPAAHDWHALDLARLRMELFIDGQRVAQIDSGPSQDGLLASLTWLANHARDRGKPLRRGDAILTGARVRSVVVERNAEVCAKVEGLGDVELSM